MSNRTFLFALALLPLGALAQSPAPLPANAAPNTTTLAVLLANCPERFNTEEWLRMMEQPLHRSLFPLRITPQMLDTLTVRELDIRYQYVMSTQTKAKPHEDH